jgi:hypothetical protein
MGDPLPWRTDASGKADALSLVAGTLWGRGGRGLCEEFREGRPFTEPGFAGCRSKGAFGFVSLGALCVVFEGVLLAFGMLPPAFHEFELHDSGIGGIRSRRIEKIIGRIRWKTDWKQLPRFVYFT